MLKCEVVQSIRTHIDIKTGETRACARMIVSETYRVRFRGTRAPKARPMNQIRCDDHAHTCDDDISGFGAGQRPVVVAALVGHDEKREGEERQEEQQDSEHQGVHDRSGKPTTPARNR